jgi:hypothetical protein
VDAVQSCGERTVADIVRVRVAQPGVSSLQVCRSRDHSSVLIGSTAEPISRRYGRRRTVSRLANDLGLALRAHARRAAKAPVNSLCGRDSGTSSTTMSTTSL